MHPQECTTAPNDDAWKRTTERDSECALSAVAIAVIFTLDLVSPSCFTVFFVSHHSRCDPAFSVFASKCQGVIVKLCTAKLCLENQNKTYRDQSYPKAFPQINKRESNFPCSLAQITPDNKQRFNTHSVSLARA